MSARNKVYVARRDCGCIVAAFPITIDKAVKGELLKQLAKAGLDIEQATDIDVRLDFNLSCDHNKPPLVSMWEKKAEAPAEDDGVDQADIDAAATDVDPEDEEALERLAEEPDEAEETIAAVEAGILPEGPEDEEMDAETELLASAELARDEQEAEEAAAELAELEIPF
jgi:hypothetical protein